MKTTILQLIEDKLWHYSRLYTMFIDAERKERLNGNFDMELKMAQCASLMLKRRESWLETLEEIK